MGRTKKHMWDRESRSDEIEVDVPVSEYPHALPRLLHKDGDHKRVDSEEACDAALTDGWALAPAGE